MPPCVHARVHATHPYSGCASCTRACTQGGMLVTLSLAKGSGPGPMAQDLCEDYLLLEKEAKSTALGPWPRTFAQGRGITPSPGTPPACGFSS